MKQPPSRRGRGRARSACGLGAAVAAWSVRCPYRSRPPGYIGRTSTAGPLTMVTAKNSTTRTPSASAMAIERWRRLFFCASVRTIPSGSCLSAIALAMCSLPDRWRNGAGDNLDQQGREQREQIEDREREQLSRRAQRFAAFAAAINIDGERQHAGAESERGYAIDRVEIAERPGRYGDRNQ